MENKVLDYNSILENCGVGREESTTVCRNIANLEEFYDSSELVCIYNYILMNIQDVNIAEFNSNNTNKFLLENNELLNNNISKDNVLSLVSRKTINIIKNTDKDYKVFDINSVDSMSLDDLRQIRENIRRIQYFNFDENKDLVKEKSLSKKLIKTK